jgi:hypothetical protein
VASKVPRCRTEPPVEARIYHASHCDYNMRYNTRFMIWINAAKSADLALD